VKDSGTPVFGNRGDASGEFSLGFTGKENLRAAEKDRIHY